MIDHELEELLQRRLPVGLHMLAQLRLHEHGRVECQSEADDYTPRLIPDHPDALVPLEASEILWQR